MNKRVIRLAGAAALAVAAAAGPGLSVAGAALDLGSSGGGDAFCNESGVLCKGDNVWRVYARVGAEGGTYKGPLQAVVGEPVLFEVETISSALTSVTHRAPDGFEFVGATVIAHDWTPGRYPYTVLPSTTTVDPESGDVTVTAGEEGWPVPLMQLPEPYSTRKGFVYIQMRYLPTAPIRNGESAMSFTASGVPATDGWMAEGRTTVTAPSTGSGSATR